MKWYYRVMIILGIETSCDETALCLLETRQPESVAGQSAERVQSTPSTPPTLEYRILGSLIHSQIDLHKQYGGVFPMMAKRAHAENLVPLLEKLIKESKISTTKLSHEAAFTRDLLEKNLTKETELTTRLQASLLTSEMPQIDAIAVTYGPGLEPALWVGINFAKVLGELWNVPVYPENHMEGHIVSTLIDDIPQQAWQALRTLEFPALAILLSGGHTEMIEARKIGDYNIIGQTRDDAVGEAFDKVARTLGLSYPGGPEVSTRAALARSQNLPRGTELPRPMIHSKDHDFSFSGLKTAVLYAVTQQKESGPLTEDFINALCREFEDSVGDVLHKKVSVALEVTNAQTLVIGGGVIANRTLRAMFTSLATEFAIPLFLPTKNLSGDNALMIALAGSIHAQTGTPPQPLHRAEGNVRLGTTRS